MVDALSRYLHFLKVVVALVYPNLLGKKGYVVVVVVVVVALVISICCRLTVVVIYVLILKLLKLPLMLLTSMMQKENMFSRWLAKHSNGCLTTMISSSYVTKYKLMFCIILPFYRSTCFALFRSGYILSAIELNLPFCVLLQETNILMR